MHKGLGAVRALDRLRPRGEDGVSLAEAVVSAMVLMLFAGAVFALIGTTLRVSKVDRERVAASNLAAREMEITRNRLRAGDAAVLSVVGAGSVTNPDPTGGAGSSVVDGVPYTVTRTAEWLPTGTGTSPCDGGATVTYPAVHLSVSVTWPAMGAVRPIISDSIVTPNKSLLNSSYAFVAVKVVTYGGAPSSNRPVSMAGPSGSDSVLTDSSGCSVFGLSAAGNHTFSLSEAGYVDFKSSTPASQVVNVTAGSFKQVSFTWDQSISLNVALVAPTGYALPSQLPAITVYNAALPSTGVPLSSIRTPASSAASTVIGGLGPYTNGYAVWAGGCSDANPAAPPTSGSASNVVVAPGQSGAATATLGALDVTGPANVAVVATHNGGTCAVTGDTTLNLGTTDASGRLLTSLPFGNWTISRAGGTPSAVLHPVPGPYSTSNPATTVVIT